MQAGTDPVGTLEAIGPEATLPVGTLGPTGPAAETREGIVRVGIPEAIGLGKTLEGTVRVGVLAATLGPIGPAAETREGIVRVGILEAIGLGKTLEGTARVGVLGVTLGPIGPAAGTREGIVLAGIMSQATGRQGMQAGTDPAGILGRIVLVEIRERIGRGEMLEGILRVAAGPGQVEGRAVRRVGPLWVVRRVGNDSNRRQVRGRVA
jgi:hypothetical protein